HERTLDRAGADAVAANALVDEVHGGGLGHGDDRALGGAIGEAAGDRELPRDGGDIDDVAALRVLRQHLVHGRLGAVVDAIDVDRDEPGEILGAGFDQVADHADAGVVDEDVEPAGSGDDIRDGGVG